MARLGEICSFQSGGTPSRKHPEFYNGSIPWITTVALNGKMIDESNAVDMISEEAINSSAAKIVPPHSIMVGTRVGIGKVAINSVPMSTSQDVVSLIGIDESMWDKGYLIKFIQGRNAFLISQSRGATIKGIKTEILADLELPHHSLTIQRCIAATLDKVSEGIALCKQIMADLDELVKSQFVDMFGNPVSNAMAWQMRPLKETCTLMTGNTPSRAEKEYYGSYIEWIKSDNITNSSLYLTTAAESLSEKGAEVGRIVHPGAILMTCIAGSLNTIGNVAIVDRDVAFNQQINAIIPHQYDTLFLCYLLKLLKPKLHEVASSALKCILNKGNLEAFTAIVPDIALQKEFSSFVAQSDKSKFAVQQQLMELETLKKSLMQEYFG